MTTTNSGDAFTARYLSGCELYGDDFDAQQIGERFADEQHGYAELYGSNASTSAVPTT